MAKTCAKEQQLRLEAEARVARLEGELAIRKGAQAKLGEEWEYEQDRARDAEGRNAAIEKLIADWEAGVTNTHNAGMASAVLREIKGILGGGVV